MGRKMEFLFWLVIGGAIGGLLLIAIKCTDQSTLERCKAHGVADLIGGETIKCEVIKGK